MVYNDTADVSSSPLGSHAVKVVGWGETQEGLKYWNVANSWGPKWNNQEYYA